jgi:hypothetical protein
MQGAARSTLWELFLGFDRCYLSTFGTGDLRAVLLGQEGISKACLPDISFLEQQVIRNIDFDWMPDPRSQHVHVTPNSSLILYFMLEFVLLYGNEF